MDDEWTPSSWRSRPIKQQPEYTDHSALENALNEGTIAYLSQTIDLAMCITHFFRVFCTFDVNQRSFATLLPYGYASRGQ